MEVKFSQHSLDQLKVRSRITKAMVLDALQNPDEVLTSYRDRQLHRKHYGKGLLEVVTI